MVDIRDDIDSFVGAEWSSEDARRRLFLPSTQSDTWLVGFHKQDGPLMGLLLFELGAGDRRAVDTRAAEHILEPGTPRADLLLVSYTRALRYVQSNKIEPGGLLPLREALFRKPLDIPLANTLCIPDDHLERVEIKSGHGVECDIEEDE